ncbi:MAG TPA: hypothetical protein VHO24_19025 [Opitutaceae bacterium]|nr:hypothetical protein [Opitutaceae bacterium]
MVALSIPFDRPVCAVCGRDTAERHFMCVYSEHGRLEFCSPACAHVFNETPAPQRVGRDGGGLQSGPATP